MMRVYALAYILSLYGVQSMPQIIEGFVAGQRYEIEFPLNVPEDEVTRATTEFFENLPLIGVRGSPSDLFEQAAQYTLENEGGYSADPDDPGGATRFGISSRSFPDVDLDSLTLQGAKDLYRREFWEKPGFDRLPFDDLAVKVFDAGVNMGTGAAGKLLQRSLNDIGSNESELLVTVDGDVGPQTLAAITQVDKDRLMSAFVIRMKKRYGDVARANPKTTKFLRGWMKRAERLPAQ